MKETKRKKSFLPAGCGGGFAGLILWVALSKIFGESIAPWMALPLMFICILAGIVLQQLDERRTEPDIIVRKNKKQNGGSLSKPTDDQKQ